MTPLPRLSIFRRRSDESNKGEPHVMQTTKPPEKGSVLIAIGILIALLLKLTLELFVVYFIVKGAIWLWRNA
ncbi:MAG: hypothetical protein QM754_18170 [Tepidisphaeraceae bacterium]